MNFTDEATQLKYEKICAIQPHLRFREGELAYEYNELGLSDLFNEIYGEEARYVPEWKSWVIYSEGRWVKDEQGILVSEMLKTFVRLLACYAREIIDGDKDEYSKFVLRTQDRRFRNRIKDDATSCCATSAELFDKNEYLINCKNGTYDLRDFSFHEHNPKDYLTMQTRFSHTPNKEVKCERWEQFISEVCNGRADKIDYLNRALGYSLLGRANEECMFILYGKTTRNGKSTLLNTVERMLGSYATAAPVGIICRNGASVSTEQASPVLASLKGRRFVTMAESAEYGKFDEEKIKQITGGEAITARALFSAPVTFIPQFTIWLSCNDLPEVSDKSLFNSERLRVISFDRHFADSEQDKTLKNQFEQEENMSGIFNWLVYGYQQYEQRGLAMSNDMQTIISLYERENDDVGIFLGRNSVRGGEYEITAADLYRHFISWVKQNHGRILPSKRFVNEMARHPEFYDMCINEPSGRVYKGLSLKSIVGGE